MVLTAYFGLSPVTGLVCHHRRQIWRVRARYGRHASAHLTPASGRQDHTTSPSASNISRQRAVDRSQAEAHPAITCRAKRCRVHRIPPRVRDDGQRPSVGRDSESYSFDLGFGKTEIFLQMGLDRQFTDLPVGQIRFDLLQQITGIRGTIFHMSSFGGEAQPRTRNP